MDLTPEQIQAIAEAVAKVSTPAPVADPVNEKAINEALAKLAKKELDITVDGYVRNLISRGGYSGSGLKERFEAFGDNTMAMGIEYKRLMEKSNEDVKLEMEAEYEAPSLDAELKTEWENFKITYKSDMTFDTYCQLAKGEGRADLSKKDPAITVDGSVKL